MRLTTALLATVAMFAFAATANAATFKQFHSPSGNINCGMGGGLSWRLPTRSAAPHHRRR